MGLKSAAGFIRREVGHRMLLRATPELHFEIDSSIERGAYISKLINDTVKQDNIISSKAHQDEIISETEKNDVNE